MSQPIQFEINMPMPGVHVTGVAIELTMDKSQPLSSIRGTWRYIAESGRVLTNALARPDIGGKFPLSAVIINEQTMRELPYATVAEIFTNTAQAIQANQYKVEWQNLDLIITAIIKK